jgi:hypothetical protein
VPPPLVMQQLGQERRVVSKLYVYVSSNVTERCLKHNLI